MQSSRIIHERIARRRARGAAHSALSLGRSEPVSKRLARTLSGAADHLLPVLASVTGRRLLISAPLAGIFILFDRFIPSIILLGLAAVLIARRWADTRGAESSGGSGIDTASGKADTDGENSAPSDISKVIPLFAPRGKETGAVEIEEILTHILESVAARFSFHSANIFLAEPEGNVLRQRAYISRSKSIARLAGIKAGVGLVGWVARHSRPLIVGNLKHEGRSLGYYRASERIGSFAAAPVRFGGKTLGVISIDHTEPDAFGPEVEEALSGAADLLAKVISAEARINEAENTVEVLRFAREISSAAAATSDLDKACEKIVRVIASKADCIAAACFLLGEGSSLSLRAGIGYHDIWAVNSRKTVGERSAAQALKQASPFRIEGAALMAQYKDFPRRGTIPGVSIAVPLVDRGEGIGAIVVDFKEPGEKVDLVMEALVLSSVEIAPLLVKVYRAREAEGAVESNDRRLDLARSLFSAGNREELFKRFMESSMTRISSTGCVIFKKSSGGGFVPEAVAGCDCPDKVQGEGSSIVGWISLTRRAALINRRDRRSIPFSEGASFIGVPVGSKGVAFLIHEKEDAFGDDDLSLFEADAAILNEALDVVGRLENARSEAEHDPLTGLYNRRAFIPRLEAMASSGPVTLLFVDIDRFKDLNDTLGHPEGDRALIAVSGIMESTLGGKGIIGRHGGEEFAVALPGVTGDEARGVAEKLRAAVAAARIGSSSPGEGGLTISTGIASLPGDATGINELFSIADRACLIAKERGRNIVISAA